MPYDDTYDITPYLQDLYNIDPNKDNSAQNNFFGYQQGNAYDGKTYGSAYAGGTNGSAYGGWTASNPLSGNNAFSGNQGSGGYGPDANSGYDPRMGMKDGGSHNDTHGGGPASLGWNLSAPMQEVGGMPADSTGGGTIPQNGAMGPMRPGGQTPQLGAMQSPYQDQITTQTKYGPQDISTAGDRMMLDGQHGNRILGYDSGRPFAINDEGYNASPNGQSVSGMPSGMESRTQVGPGVYEYKWNTPDLKSPVFNTPDVSRYDMKQSPDSGLNGTFKNQWDMNDEGYQPRNRMAPGMQIAQFDTSGGGKSGSNSAPTPDQTWRMGTSQDRMLGHFDNNPDFAQGTGRSVDNLNSHYQNGLFSDYDKPLLADNYTPESNNPMHHSPYQQVDNGPFGRFKPSIDDSSGQAPMRTDSEKAAAREAIMQRDDSPLPTEVNLKDLQKQRKGMQVQPGQTIAPFGGSPVSSAFQDPSKLVAYDPNSGGSIFDNVDQGYKPGKSQADPVLDGLLQQLQTTHDPATINKIMKMINPNGSKTNNLKGLA